MCESYTKCNFKTDQNRAGIMFSAVHFSLFLLLKTNLIDLRVLDEIYQ